jgi:hypothetical protein
MRHRIGKPFHDTRPAVKRSLDDRSAVDRVGKAPGGKPTPASAGGSAARGPRESTRDLPPRTER